ncbi:MAG: hypothetical protein JWM80_5940, partial [Cyanobacteria bacterium RYN_339]|nr:hypothetical protein [Cyanobacteria bacterium RYN_339]
RWPEHRLAAPAVQGPAPGLAEALALVDDMRHASSVHDLANRLLHRLVDFTGAQAGALLVYRDLQVDAVALAFLEEAAALERPEVEAALWDRLPVFDGGHWALPVAEDGVLLAIVYLEDADASRQATFAAMGEALRLSLAQFLRLQAFEAQVERLALSERLARLALEGHAPREVVRTALAVALAVTGAERALVVRGEDLAMGVDAAGRELPADTPFSRTICRWVHNTREAVRLVDAQEMEGWQQAQSILALGLRTLVAVPLVAGDAVLGVLYVDSTDVLKMLGAREQGLLEAAARVLAPMLTGV